MEDKSKLIGIIQSQLGTGNILLIVPPFAPIDRPSLAIHLLQATASQSGFKTDVLYANLMFARMIGIINYKKLAHVGPPSLLCERVFARTAYGVPPLGHDRGVDLTLTHSSKPIGKTTNEELCKWTENKTTNQIGLNLKHLGEIENQTDQFISIINESLCKSNYSIVGCSSTLQQHAPSIAILNSLKKTYPVTTIIGGANCDGNLAQGTQSLSPHIDHIFSGESDHTFVEFLMSILKKKETPQRIVRGNPVPRMNDLPTPNYTEFYDQFNSYILDQSKTITNKNGSKNTLNPIYKQLADSLYLNYETSRGCWWGEKHHCTFCGLNGEGMGFREKSSDKVIEELKILTSNHPNNQIVMTDNIMPNAYYHSLIKEIPKSLPGLKFFWEQKSNISLKKMMGLSKAGVGDIQPGIESLSTPLLRLMDKGVTSRQNIATLRYAKSLGINVHWNLIWAFPNDKISWYQDTLDLIPLIRHLKPARLINLSIDRFSPYYERPDDYSITKLSPLSAYKNIFPKNSSYDSLAYHFTGSYASESLENLNVMYELGNEVNNWLNLWLKKPFPFCSIAQLDSEEFILEDNRFPENGVVKKILSREEAKLALVPESVKNSDPQNYEWALNEKLVVALDSYYVPLATANPNLLLEFESEKKHVDSSTELIRAV